MNPFLTARRTSRLYLELEKQTSREHPRCVEYDDAPPKHTSGPSETGVQVWGNCHLHLRFWQSLEKTFSFQLPSMTDCPPDFQTFRRPYTSMAQAMTTCEISSKKNLQEGRKSDYENRLCWSIQQVYYIHTEIIYMKSLQQDQTDVGVCCSISVFLQKQVAKTISRALARKLLVLLGLV